MTAGDRGDVIFSALAVSALIHGFLMFAIQSQVMTRVVRDGSARPRREALVVRDAPKPTEALKLEYMKDVEAPRAAPEAEAVDLGSVAVARGLPEIEDGGVTPVADRVEAASAGDAPDTERPVFADKVELVTFERSDSPIADPGPVSVPFASAPSPVGPSAAEVDIPMFLAPTVAPEPLRDAGPSKVSPVVAPKAAEFTPAAEIYAEVDEKAVEAEKAAVREIVNADAAGDLRKVAACSLKTVASDGWRYFSLTVTPKAGALPAAPKDVVVLLDASGSIGNDRLVSCRNAAKRILRTAMNTGDRFNLVAFRDKFSYAFRSWQNCGAASYAAADKWLANLAAHGRTDVFSTIRSVMTLPRDPKRPLVAVVVTDGDANAGVSETAEIISRFSRLNGGLVSVYMYGVKGNSNTALIDILTHGNRGESMIHDGMRWRAGEGLEAFSERFRDPIVSDLRLVFSSKCRAEAYPYVLKNLYLGNSVEVIGRVPLNVTEIAFSLKGQNAGRAYEGFYRLPVAEGEVDPALAARFAAERQVNVLLH